MSHYVDGHSRTVFISYSTADKQAARRLCESLENQGISCWIAERNIRPGDEWRSAIAEAIRSAAIVVVVVSRSADKSDDVKNELAIAKRAGKSIVPARIEDFQPASSDFEYELSRLQRVDLFRNWQSGVRSMAERIRSDVARGVPGRTDEIRTADRRGPVDTSGMQAQRRQRYRAAGWLAGGVALVIVAAVIYQKMWSLDPTPRLEVVGLISGASTPSTFKQQVSGVLTIDAGNPGNGQRSFRYLKLEPQWTSNPRLRIDYSCVYWSRPHDYVSQTITAPQACPPTAGFNSDVVKAIRMTLSGADASLYRLEYDCAMGVTDMPTVFPQGRVSAGEWCGQEPDRPGFGYLTKLTIYLEKR
jgi:hypothetical protein